MLSPWKRRQLHMFEHSRRDIKTERHVWQNSDHFDSGVWNRFFRQNRYEMLLDSSTLIQVIGFFQVSPHELNFPTSPDLFIPQTHTIYSSLTWQVSQGRARSNQEVWRKACVAIRRPLWQYGSQQIFRTETLWNVSGLVHVNSGYWIFLKSARASWTFRQVQTFSFHRRIQIIVLWHDKSAKEEPGATRRYDGRHV